MKYILLALLFISSTAQAQLFAFNDPVLTGSESLLTRADEHFIFGRASTYYVAANGSDLNPGSITQPYGTIGKLSAVMHAGDIAYIRGGTYTSVAGNAADVHFLIQNLTGTLGAPILIQNYPGEVPMFNTVAITPTANYPCIMKVYNCTYLTVKGLTIKNLKQVATGQGVSYGFIIDASAFVTATQLNVFDIGGTGCTIQNTSHDITYLNCDSHNNGDGVSPDQWNFGDGFTCTNDNSYNISFIGCRAWMNGDDNYDWFEWRGTNCVVKDCWAFWASIKPWGRTTVQPIEDSITPSNPALWASNNAYRTSTTSGEGFKAGGCNIARCTTGGMTTLKKQFINCVSTGNSGTGISYNFTEGATYAHIQLFQNCTFVFNGNDGIGGATPRNTGLYQRIDNCIAYGNNLLDSGGDLAYNGLCDSIHNNYWNTVYDQNCGNLKGSITINNSDFVSTDQSQLVTARQADGSLPVITFMHYVSGSDGIDAGLIYNVANRPYNGTAPDLGAFEYSSVPPTPVLPTANAGADKALILPTNSVSVTGTVTGSITPLTYLWTCTPAATITGSTTLTATFSALTVGTYRVGFRVTDASLNTSIDSMLIVVSSTGTIIASPVIRLATLWQGHIILDITSTNGLQMEVERSVGTGGFVRLGAVEAKVGYTGYGFIDWSPVTGSNSYRVKTGPVYSAVVIKKKQ